MKTILVFLLIIASFYSCRKIARGKVYFADKAFYNEGRRASGGLFFLRKLYNNKVYDNEDKALNIIIPAAFKNKKLAWGSTYFTGMKRRTTKPEIFYLIASYDDSVSQIVFDKNGNSDFTDDSIQKIIHGKLMPVRINNHNDPYASIQLDFAFYQDAPDTIYDKLFKMFTFTRKDGISPKYISVDRNKYYRIIKLPGNQVITLYDLNVNGTFNDRYDKIIAGDIRNNKKIRYNSTLTKYVRSGIELPFGNNTYRLVEVDKYGNSVELIALNKKSDTVEILPPFNYINEKNQLVHFDFDHSKKYSLLYIWGSWCIGCWTQAPLLVSVMEKYSGNTAFYALNHGDSVLKMMDYLAKKKYPFTKWRLDYRNAEKLNSDGFPHYILFDKQRRILLRTLNILEVDSALLKLNKKN